MRRLPRQTLSFRNVRIHSRASPLMSIRHIASFRREDVPYLSSFLLTSNVSVHRRRLVRRTVERLVGIYVLAVHALDLSEIVAARSMLFAGGWWRIHFTCGSPYILIPTSRVRGPDTLWRVPWTRLLAFVFYRTCPKTTLRASLRS